MNEDRPNYYAVIPSRIRYDRDLTPNEKLLYGEITALTNKSGECWATNKYFAELYNVEVQTVSRWLKKLKEKQYLDINFKYKKDTKEIENRIIKISGEPINKNVKTYSQNCDGGINKNVNGVLTKMLKNNNTSINNTRLIKEKYKKEIFFKNTEVNELFIEFLKLREKMKVINTDRAIKILINKLNKYNDDTKIEMISTSIERSWKSVFPISNKNINDKDITNEEMEEIAKKYDSK